jgi:pimeloyl-ACP methyl ester carboxylesterase
MSQWQGFDRELASRGFRVIIFDNRDAGASDKLTSQLPDPLAECAKQRAGEDYAIAYCLSDMVDDCLAVLTHFGVTSGAHIIGQSMGGLLAQVFATTYPRHVLTLTLIMTAIPFWPAMAKSAAQDHGVFLGKIGALYATLPAPHESMSLPEFIACRMPFWELLADWSDGELSRRKYEQLLTTDYRRRGVDWGGMGGFRQTLAINHWEDQHLAAHLEALPRCQAPTLVLHGREDPLIPVACGRELAALIPGSQFFEYPGGHNLGSFSNERVLCAMIANHLAVIAPARGSGATAPTD